MARTKSMEDYLVVPEPEPPPMPRLVIPAGEKAGVLEALSDIRALFGKNGQNWITGAEHEHYEPSDDPEYPEYHPTTGEVLRKAFDGYCLIGGVYAVDGRYENAARLAISMAIAEQEGLLEGEDDPQDAAYILTDDSTIIDFNDHTATWDDIKDVLKRAKELVRKADTK